MTRVFDCHDEAFYCWREAGVRQATLVHVDAHHDLEPAREDGAIDIGNFIRAAVAAGHVSRVYWVVPDPMWRDPPTRAWLRRELLASGAAGLSVTDETFRCAIEAAPVWAGPLTRLPSIRESVLLDVDVDYLFHSVRHKRASKWPDASPWQTPRQLAEQVHARGLRPRITTIALSVTGGFTPLAWRHLGDEIARALADPSSALDTPAAAHDFQRAETLQRRGALEEARAAFRAAVSAEPAYRHPFRTRGFWFLRHDRLDEAAAAFGDGLDLDPDDVHAELGLAMIAARRGQAADARARAERVLARSPSGEAWRTLARALAREGDRRAARQAYLRAIALTLRGEVPINGPWASNPDHRLADPWHWQDHLELARVLEQDGDGAGAMAHYRIAALAAPRARRVRLRVGLAHLRRGQLAAAARFLRPRRQDFPRWRFS